MTEPNPFSTSNAPQHNLVSKITNNPDMIGYPYEVQVDLVDIDTGYMRQIGATYAHVEQQYLDYLGDIENPVQQEYVVQIGDNVNRTQDIYVDTLHWKHLDPVPGGGGGGFEIVGGTGITVGYDGNTYTISSLIEPGFGIGLTLDNNYWKIDNTGVLSVSGSTGLSVSGTTGNVTVKNTGVLSVSGTTGISVSGTTGAVTIQNTGVLGVSGGTGIKVTSSSSGNYIFSVSGITGIAAGSNIFIDNSNPQFPQINSSGGSTGSPGLTGPLGDIVYTTPVGLESTSKIRYDTGAQTLTVPTTVVSSAGHTGSIIFETFGEQSRIIPSHVLHVSSIENVDTLTVDINKQFVGINKSPTVELDVEGQAVIQYVGLEAVTGGTGVSGSCVLNAGQTYNIQIWGGGAAGNSGAGGAGGYLEIVSFPSIAGGTLAWSQGHGGAGGGGNSVNVTYNGTPIFIVPGGGAGTSAGTSGAAAGESQGYPRPEGGVNPDIPYTTSYARYNDIQNWNLTTTAAKTLNGAGFDGGTIYGTTGVISDFCTFTFPNGGTFVTQNNVSTYYAYTGPLTINSGGIIFSGATFQATGTDNLLIPNGTTFTCATGGAFGGTGTGVASYYGLPPTNLTPAFDNSIIRTGTTGITASAGDIYWSTGVSGSTFNVGSNPNYVGITWIFSGTHTIIVSDNGHIVTCETGVSFQFPGNLPHVTNSVIQTSGSVNVPVGTPINVAERDFYTYGATANGGTGSTYGGGGYTGGGSPALIPEGVLVPYGVTGTVVGTTYNNYAGGAGGNWYIAPSYTGTTAAGFETNPYENRYFPGNSYATGTIGSTLGTPGYLLVQKIDPNNPDPALTVDGWLNVTGGSTIAKTATFNGQIVANAGITGTTATFSGALLANGGLTGTTATFSGALLANGGITGTSAYFNAITLYGINPMNPSYSFPVYASRAFYVTLPIGQTRIEITNELLHPPSSFRWWSITATPYLLDAITNYTIPTSVWITSNNSINRGFWLNATPADPIRERYFSVIAVDPFNNVPF
jgi:collagen type VII alpha